MVILDVLEGIRKDGKIYLYEAKQHYNQNYSSHADRPRVLCDRLPASVHKHTPTIPFCLFGHDCPMDRYAPFIRKRGVVQ